MVVVYDERNQSRLCHRPLVNDMQSQITRLRATQKSIHLCTRSVSHKSALLRPDRPAGRSDTEHDLTKRTLPLKGRQRKLSRNNWLVTPVCTLSILSHVEDILNKTGRDGVACKRPPPDFCCGGLYKSRLVHSGHRLSLFRRR